MRWKINRKLLQSHHGYTLVEILVVLFILSVVAGAVLLSIRPTSSKEIENVAKEVSQILSLVEEEAILQQTVFGLDVNPPFLQFYQLLANPKPSEKVKWARVASDVSWAHYAIPPHLQIRIHLKYKPKEEEEEKKDPPIIFSTNGSITPFELFISSKKEDNPSAMITAREDGVISVKLIQ